MTGNYIQELHLNFPSIDRDNGVSHNLVISFGWNVFVFLSNTEFRDKTERLLQTHRERLTLGLVLSHAEGLALFALSVHGGRNSYLWDMQWLCLAALDGGMFNARLAWPAPQAGFLSEGPEDNSSQHFIPKEGKANGQVKGSSNADSLMLYTCAIICSTNSVFAITILQETSTTPGIEQSQLWSWHLNHNNKCAEE
jgi:hypothetical protein